MSYELYKKDKIENFEMLLIYRVGIFYEVYNEDAYILHYLTKYNIMKYKKYHRVGFPIKKLNAIKNLLNYNGIGCTVNEGVSLIKNEVINNYYEEFLNKSIIIADKEGLIYMITDKLSSMDKSSLEKLYLNFWYQ